MALPFNFRSIVVLRECRENMEEVKVLTLEKEKKKEPKKKTTIKFEAESKADTSRTKRLSKSYFNELKTRSINFPSVLLIFYAIPITMSLSIGQAITLNLFTTTDEHCHSYESTPSVSNNFYPRLIQSILMFCLHPLTGWVADIKIGRQKAINWSLWFCWFGTFLQALSYCLQYGTCDHGTLDKVAKFGISVVALPFLMIGVAGYHTNVLAYGMDQLPDASNAQIRRFIHWLTWAFFMGFFFNYIAIIKTFSLSNKLSVFTTFATFVLLSFAVILHIFFRHKFVYSGTVKRNPYSTIIKVLKYSWQHKSPENRSALTYWEDEIPSRINLGKEKYGGPFFEGDVEDTKTFWRMVTIFCSLGGIFIPYFTVVNQGSYYGVQFKGGMDLVHGYSAYVVWQSFFQIAIVAIPLTDLIVIPLVPKIEYFILNPLRGFGMAMLMLLCGLLSMAVIEIVGQVKTRQQLPCYLKITPHADTLFFNLSYLFFMVPWFFVGIAALLSFLKAFEFICCQAPNEMSGMITGVFWLIRATFITFGALLSLPITLLNVKFPYNLPCTFWVLLLQILISIVFGITFIIVSKWYQRRQREMDCPVRNEVERRYSMFLHSSYIGNRGINNGDLFNKYELPLAGWSDNTIPVQSRK